MKRIDNESGVAYAFYMILVLLITGSIVWMTISYGFNLVMIPINDRISDGVMSQQTAGPITFGMSVLGAIPVFLLVGTLIWAVLAAVNKRNEGG